MTNEYKIERALISVSDKSGLAPLVRALDELGVEILSTGGTSRAIAEAGARVTEVSSFTGFDEMLDGRVKTLHPKVHAGILHRRDLPEHVAQMAARGFAPIDLVVVNLYPFESTIAKPGVTYEEAIENIDIGGPCLLRAAAKNHAHVTVLSDPADYSLALTEIKTAGGTSLATRKFLAQKAFARTSAYDAAISAFLSH